jgi:hypothetical protein
MQNCCPEPINKQDPCWDGYVQRGMKPGANGKMVPNCVPAEKADTPMDVAYNPIATDPTPANPSSSINPSVGMKKPQYMMNFGRQVGGGIHDKRIVDIWTVKVDTEEGIIPTVEASTYDGCDCEACMVLNVDCPDCPVCSGYMAMPEKSDAPMPENPIMPTNTYQGCSCPECVSGNIPCSSCPNCGGGSDAETEMSQKRDFNSKERQRMASSGAAMPDGSFPIANAQDLASAIRLYGHAKNPEAAKAHIKRRAAALGLTGSLPDSWKSSSKSLFDALMQDAKDFSRDTRSDRLF